MRVNSRSRCNAVCAGFKEEYLLLEMLQHIYVPSKLLLIVEIHNVNLQYSVNDKTLHQLHCLRYDRNVMN